MVFRIPVVGGVEHRGPAPGLLRQRGKIRTAEHPLRIRLETVRGKPRLSARGNHRLGHAPIPRPQCIVGIGAAGDLRHDLTVVHAPRPELIRRIFLQARAVKIDVHVGLVLIDHRHHRRQLRRLLRLDQGEGFHVPDFSRRPGSGVRIHFVLVAESIRVEEGQGVHHRHHQHNLPPAGRRCVGVVAQKPLEQRQRTRRAAALGTAVQRRDEANLLVRIGHGGVGDLHQPHRQAPAAQSARFQRHPLRVLLPPEPQGPFVLRLRQAVHGRIGRCHVRGAPRPQRERKARRRHASRAHPVRSPGRCCRAPAGRPVVVWVSCHRAAIQSRRSL